jgi:Flp pilus assembly protein TadD
MTGGNMDYSFQDHQDHSDNDSLTGTLAAAIGSGIVGATIGQALSGRMGATVGAIVGGLAGVSLAKDPNNGIARLSEKAVNQVKSASKSLKEVAEDRVDSFKHPSERATLLHSDDEMPTLDARATLLHSDDEMPTLDARATLLHSDDEMPTLDAVVMPTKAHNRLGVFLGRHGDLNEAIREFQVALDRQPNSAVAHYNLGVALCKQGNRVQGIEHLKQAKRLCLRQGKRSGRKAVEYALRQLQPKSNRTYIQSSIG